MDKEVVNSGNGVSIDIDNTVMSFLRDELVHHVDYITKISMSLEKSEEIRSSTIEEMIDRFKKDKSDISKNKIVDMNLIERMMEFYSVERVKVGARINLIYQIAGERIMEGLSENTKNIINSFLKDKSIGFILDSQSEHLSLIDKDKEEYMRSSMLDLIPDEKVESIMVNISEMYEVYKKQYESYIKRKDDIKGKIKHFRKDAEDLGDIEAVQPTN